MPLLADTLLFVNAECIRNADHSIINLYWNCVYAVVIVTRFKLKVFIFICKHICKLLEQFRWCYSNSGKCFSTEFISIVHVIAGHVYLVNSVRVECIFFHLRKTFQRWQGRSCEWACVCTVTIMITLPDVFTLHTLEGCLLSFYVSAVNRTVR